MYNKLHMTLNILKLFILFSIANIILNISFKIWQIEQIKYKYFRCLTELLKTCFP